MNMEKQEKRTTITFDLAKGLVISVPAHSAASDLVRMLIAENWFTWQVIKESGMDDCKAILVKNACERENIAFEQVASIAWLVVKPTGEIVENHFGPVQDVAGMNGYYYLKCRIVYVVPRLVGFKEQLSRQVKAAFAMPGWMLKW